MNHYLMVHDLVWINTTVTGESVAFDYARAEAAIAAQYDYGRQGSATDVAGRVLGAMLVSPPFAYGNRRTAFVAALALLNANGYRDGVGDTDAAVLVRRAATREIDPQEAAASLATPGDADLPPGTTLRQLVSHICNAHTDALARLQEGDE